jgi:hypothetical protein
LGIENYSDNENIKGTAEHQVKPLFIYLFYYEKMLFTQKLIALSLFLVQVAVSMPTFDKRATQQEVADQVYAQEKAQEEAIENAFKKVVGEKAVAAFDAKFDPIINQQQLAVANAAGKAKGTK